LIGSVVKTTTDGSGSFSITGDYSCPSGSQVYLTASGGNSSGSATATNPNITLMAALGSCATLLSNASTADIFVDEVSTVAAAYALAQFAAPMTTFGTALVSQPGTSTAAPSDNISVSSSNGTGLTNAMATARVLANYYGSSSAPPNGFAPGSNANGTATSEYWTINTIADILAACVNSSVTSVSTSGDGTTCGSLYKYTTPSGKTPPADTFQAALYMALYPSDANLLSGTSSGKNLTSLISSTPPFVPYVSPGSTGNTINDWTIAIQYTPVATATTTALINEPFNLAADSVGNIWINNINSTGNSYLLEVDPTGDPILAGETTCAAATCAATDYQVNGYYKSGGGTTKYMLGAEPGGGSPSNFAIDPANNVWYVDRANRAMVFFEGSGSGSTVNGGSNKSNTKATSIGTAYQLPSGDVTIVTAVDGTGTPWFTVNAAGLGACSSNSIATGGGSTLAYISGATTTTGSGTTASPYNYGSGGTVNYGATQGVTATSIAIDGGNPSCTAGSTTSLCNATILDKVSGSSTALAGSPFVWVGSNAGDGVTDAMVGTSLAVGFLGHNLSTTGCESPLAQIATSDTAAGSSDSYPTTTVGSINPSGSDQIDFGLKLRNLSFGQNYLSWMIDNNVQDVSGTVSNTIVAFTPNYGSAFTPAQYVASEPTTPFTSYNNIGGLGTTTGFAPQGLMVDGSSSVWAVGYATGGAPVVHLNTSGAVSGSSGITGTTYTNGSTKLARTLGASYYTGTLDMSGNVWVPVSTYTVSGTATNATYVYEIVGAATPVVMPLSIGTKNGTLGAMP
jgi:hypothetical protein